MSNIADIDFGSESEDGGDFSPAPALGSDEELGSDQERPALLKSASKPTSRRPSPRPRPESLEEEEEGVKNGDANGRFDDDDEDEGEEDEEDEDEEDAVTGRPRKRARRDPRNQFIDIEAEVDDEDEGDEDLDEDEGAGGFIAENHPDDLTELPPGTETDDRGHRELDRKREMEQQLDAEKQAALLKERYGRSRATATDAALVPKRLLLPSVDDPSIWGVRCKPGKEREVVFSIMKRIDERASSKNPMPISSAFERGGTAMVGYVYVEARKQSDIMAALDGIMNVYPRTKMVLVSIKEMPDLLRVTKSEQLQPNGYVRLKRGKYQGDLALIDDVESNGLEVTLKIVPRLDYGLNEDANGPAADGADAQKRKRAAFGLTTPASRPPQRLFSEAEAKKKHSRYLQSMSTFDKKHWTYLGDTYVNGYLIKDFKIQHLTTQNVNPTLEEVTKFAAGAEDGTENLDLTALAASLKNNTASDNFLPGDIVEVYEGEQQGISGKASSVRGDIVTLTVTEGELRGQDIEVPTKGLRKRFREGDHVKVIGGSSRFRDEVGMVVRLKDDRVTILSDLSMQEITVFSKDLREATDTGVAGGLGRYDIHDLVQLDPATVGCVTKVDRESLRILDQNASVRSIMPSQISNKIERRRHAVATDRNGSEIRQDDTVREVGGEGKQGVIIHIHRSFLFLHNREQTENSGIFVVRATNVATVAAKGGRVAQQAATGPDLARMNPAAQRNGANGGSAMPPPKSFGRDRAIGQTVTVRKGPYKGLLGIVKDTTDSEARVELHTKSKTIQVSKDVLAFKDPISGNSMDYQTFASRGRGRGVPSGGSGGSNGGGGFGGATPHNDSWGGSRTPMASGNGGRTPAWGAASSRTPAWSGGGGGGAATRTPRWQQESSSTFGGGRTPAWTAEGGRTSYGGGGGRTPAWDPGSRTSYGSNQPGSSSSGSKTPAYTDSSRTPAYTPGPSASSFSNPPPANPASTLNPSSANNADPWSSHRPIDAPTPAAPTPGSDSSHPYSAPTPGAGQAYSAPTPGGYSAPTPYNSAPTPAAASAPTPGYIGGYDAPTPAGAPTPFSGGVDTPAWGGEDEDGEGDGDDGAPRYAEDEDE